MRCRRTNNLFGCLHACFECVFAFILINPTVLTAPLQYEWNYSDTVLLIEVNGGIFLVL